MLLYGDLPSAKELARFEEAVGRHSAVPAAVEDAINALPHDAHFMGTILVGINALSTCHPEQNPALAGQDVYKSKEIQDKQIVRLIGMSNCMHTWQFAKVFLCLLMHFKALMFHKEVDQFMHFVTGSYLS